MNYINKILFILILSSFTQLQAQTPFYAYLFDQDSHEGIKITINSLTDTSFQQTRITNEDGEVNFDLYPNPWTTFNLTLEYPGYHTKNLIVSDTSASSNGLGASWFLKGAPCQTIYPDHMIVISETFPDTILPNKQYVLIDTCIVTKPVSINHPTTFYVETDAIFLLENDLLYLNPSNDSIRFINPTIINDSYFACTYESNPVFVIDKDSIDISIENCVFEEKQIIQTTENPNHGTRFSMKNSTVNSVKFYDDSAFISLKDPLTFEMIENDISTFLDYSEPSDLLKLSDVTNTITLSNNRLYGNISITGRDNTKGDFIFSENYFKPNTNTINLPQMFVESAASFDFECNEVPDALNFTFKDEKDFGFSHKLDIIIAENYLGASNFHNISSGNLSISNNFFQMNGRTVRMKSEKYTDPAFWPKMYIDRNTFRNGIFVIEDGSASLKNNIIDTKFISVSDNEKGEKDLYHNIFGKESVVCLSCDENYLTSNLFQEEILFFDTTSHNFSPSSTLIKDSLQTTSYPKDVLGYKSNTSCESLIRHQINYDSLVNSLIKSSISGNINSEGLIMAISTTTGEVQMKEVKEGEYLIDSLKQDKYIVYAIPELSSNMIPTAFVNHTNITNANIMDLHGTITDANFDFLTYQKPSNNYSVEGRVVYENPQNHDQKTDYSIDWYNLNNYNPNSANPFESSTSTLNPAQYLPVIIKNLNSDIIAWGLTDNLGYFSIYTPNTDFTIEAERWGYNLSYRQEKNTSVTFVEGKLFTDKTVLGKNNKGISQSDFSCFPNPIQNEFSIEFNNIVDKTLTITDVSGKIIYQKQIDSNRVNIETNTWERGIYLISVGQIKHKISKL